MDLNDIIVFTRVADTRSFTIAGEQLGLPKSTVSRKLAQLEERLGVRLVQRTTRKLALTEIGEAYYARCARIVADLASADQLVNDMQTTPRGRVRITAPIDLATRYLGSIIAAFLRQHPDVFVELDASDRVVDLIEEGFDVAVRFGPLQESTLVAKRLCSLSAILCASPDYVARRGLPTAIEQLDDHDRVLFTPNQRVDSWTLVNGTATYELGRPARFASNNLGAVYSAVCDGLGIAMLNEFMVGCDIRAGKLVEILPPWRSVAFEMFAVYASRHNVPPRLALLIEHLQRAFDPPPWVKS